jgi:hypothetical protein
LLMLLISCLWYFSRLVILLDILIPVVYVSMEFLHSQPLTIKACGYQDCILWEDP